MSQRLIPTGKRSGSQTPIAATENISLCTRKIVDGVYGTGVGTSTVPANWLDNPARFFQESPSNGSESGGGLFPRWVLRLGFRRTVAMGERGKKKVQICISRFSLNLKFHPQEIHSAGLLLHSSRCFARQSPACKAFTQTPSPSPTQKTAEAVRFAWLSRLLRMATRLISIPS